MNQIAASILILSAAILGHTATVQVDQDGISSLCGLAAIGLGLWGAMSLLTSAFPSRVREPLASEVEQDLRAPATASGGLRKLVYPQSPNPSVRGSRYPLSPETDARLSALAELRRQGRPNANQPARPRSSSAA